MSTGTKSRNILWTLGVIALIVAGASLFDASNKDEDAAKLTIHAAQTLEGRTNNSVIVVVLVNNKPYGTFYPDKQTWSQIIVVPKGQSVGMGVWQTTPGTVSCAIRRDGKVVSNDIKSKVIVGSPSLTAESTLEFAAKCYYLVT